MSLNNQKNIAIKFHISETLYKNFFSYWKKKGVKVNDRIRQLIQEDAEKNTEKNKGF